MCDRTRKLSFNRRDQNLSLYCAHLQRNGRENEIVNWIAWIYNQMPSIHDLNGLQKIVKCTSIQWLYHKLKDHWSVMTTTLLIVRFVLFYLASIDIKSYCHPFGYVCTDQNVKVYRKSPRSEWEVTEWWFTWQFSICDWDNPMRVILTIRFQCKPKWIINVQFTVELWACFHSINFNISAEILLCDCIKKSYTKDNGISLSFIWLNCPFSKLFKFTFPNE